MINERKPVPGTEESVPGTEKKYAFEDSLVVMAAMEGYYFGREEEMSMEDFDRVIDEQLTKYENEFGEDRGNNSRALSKLHRWFNDLIKRLPTNRQVDLARKLAEDRRRTNEALNRAFPLIDPYDGRGRRA